MTLEALRSEDVQVSAEDQRRLLREWAERGQQGPLDADDTWPDET
jgi:hypothetical protein